MSNSPQNGQLTLVQHNLPPLMAGEYTVSVTQTVQVGEIDYQGTKIAASEQDTYHSSSLTFFVRADRFRLQPSDVQSAFPPPDSIGNYTNVLPHVVLTRPRLPWAWSLTGGAQTPNPGGDVATWMALLVFDALDPAPAAVTRTLSDLKSPSSGVVSYPNLALAPGEALTDPVITIDVPVALWNQIAPSSSDLSHLAHCRVASPAGKASDPSNAQNQYSVVIANRLPSGQKTTAHLVCLEGMVSYLPGSGQSLPWGAQTIRLASLASFQFSAAPETVSFSGTLQKVITPNLPATLRLPSPSSGNQTVTHAFEMGYTAFPHQTRLGASTVSWYRGPLVPFAASTSNRLSSPARNADALLRYNPQTGMFDASYAAAWQLGRLLALQNREYAVALYRWKHDHPTSGETPPDTVSNWLGRLSLLYGVPYNYLVPDERMLPNESLRFFQVDPLWMDCLMDGAFSMGRSTTTVLTQDTGTFDQIRQSAIAAARRVRSNWLEQAGGGEAPASPGNGIITGFLLRSEVISAYPGMEIRGYARTDPTDKTAPVAVLRYESLAPNVRLCLFDGAIGHIVCRQPPEALHFGLDVQGQTFTKQLRSLSTGQETSSSVNVGFRGGNKHVVQISDLASSMAGALRQTPFTSDQFAMEMIEGVQEVFFIRQN